jgi:type I restriction enzyme S subunit
MEMRAGYKRTDAGIIPVDWKVNTLGEIGDVRMCKRVLKQQTRSNGDVPFYKIGTFGGVADAYINHSLFEEFKRKYSYPKKGDVLISAAGTIGRSVIFDGSPSYFQDSNIVWIENDESKATNEYLWHRYQVTKWAVSHGGTVARLYNDSLRTKIHIPVPTLSEQRAISLALSDVDALITALDRLIAKKSDIKKATMWRLINGTTRIPGFSSAWKEERLGDLIIKLRKTTRPSSAGRESGSFPFFTNTTKPVERYLDEADFDTEAIIANTGGEAYFNYYNGRFAAMSDCMVLEARINTKYLYYFLKLLEQSINCDGFTGSGIKHLDKKYFRNIALSYPTEIDEQNAITSVLTDMDAEIFALEARRDKTRALKQGMMQELLTGKTRLL